MPDRPRSPSWEAAATNSLTGGPATTCWGGPGTDTLRGGDGEDLVAYADHAAPVDVTLDGQANDGSAGENDLVASDIEDVYGSPFADRLVGDAAGNVLWGDDGDDVLVGGAGLDSLSGQGGDDLLEARDGAFDELDCGIEDGDVASVDDVDLVFECATVVGPESDSTPQAPPSPAPPLPPRPRVPPAAPVPSGARAPRRRDPAGPGRACRAAERDRPCPPGDAGRTITCPGPAGERAAARRPRAPPPGSRWVTRRSRCLRGRAGRCGSRSAPRPVTPWRTAAWCTRSCGHGPRREPIADHSCAA